MLDTIKELEKTIASQEKALKLNECIIALFNRHVALLEKEVKKKDSTIARQDEEIRVANDRIVNIRTTMFEALGKKVQLAILAILNHAGSDAIRLEVANIDGFRFGETRFSRKEKEYIERSLSTEETIEGRKGLVEKEIAIARVLKDDLDYWDDVYHEMGQIAEGKWDAAQDRFEKRQQLLKAAVKAVVDKGNTPGQKHFSEKQVAAILEFIAYDGGERADLFDEIWQEAEFMIKYYGWQKMAKRTLDTMEANLLSGKGIPLHDQGWLHKGRII